MVLGGVLWKRPGVGQWCGSLPTTGMPVGSSETVDVVLLGGDGGGSYLEVYMPPEISTYSFCHLMLNKA